MLPRVLEPEVMDTPEEARDYDAMDHAEVNRVFVRDFLERWDGQNPILDVGTGTAQIPIELCRQSPGALVVAIDLAAHMLKVAAENVGVAGLAERVHLKHVDAKGLPFEAGSFGAVMSNSIVHHIPEPRASLAEMIRVVRPGGFVFVRDLARPFSERALQHLVAQYAGDANEHQQSMFAASLHAALTVEEMRSLLDSLGQDPALVEMTSDRHWTWAARVTSPARS